MFCTQCGQQNPDGSRFCARCGSAISTSIGAPARGNGTSTTSTISLPALDVGEGPAGTDAADPSLGELPPAGTALLVVKRGPNAGSRFLLDADVTTAGRHPESDIFLDDVTVSRRHAEFVRQGNGFLVRDVGSLNGTYLGRERIESTGLANGDEVQIGKYRLVFLSAAPGGGR